MNVEQYRSLQQWFKNYARSFREPESSHQVNLDLKEEHTLRVCAAMDRITSGLGLPAEVCRVAATVALFHDLGRFPQYKKFRTFRDPDSTNHARLSLLELHRHKVLDFLDPAARRLIGRAVVLHNRLLLPAGLDPETLLHCRLIRDADKLDILRVMAEHFRLPEEERDPVVTLGFDSKGGIRQEVYDRFFAGRIMGYGDLVSVSEFKMLLLSWVFDLNFRPSFAILKEQEHIGAIAATLPDTPLHRKVTRHFREYIDWWLREDGQGKEEKEEVH